MLALFAGQATGIESKEFEQAYSDVSESMLSNDGEVAEVSNFEYQKDAAHFNFIKGKFLLRRPVLGRPSVAMFVGEGSVTIDVPFYLERQRLFAMTGDSSVHEQFKICHIRFADDFDAELRAKFKFSPGSLSAKEFQQIKSFQGDYFFKPIPQHGTDNYFQLLRSAYNRTNGGFFWACFGRFVFSFDQSRTDEVEILYNREPSSLTAFRGGKFPRKERCTTQESVWPEVLYSQQAVAQTTNLSLAGIDGMVIASGWSTLSMVQLRDSTRFLSVYLDKILNLDSITCADLPLSFQRRNNFDHVAILLSSVLHEGDTVEVTLWYHGRDYWISAPWIENPHPHPHTLDINPADGFDYLLPTQAVTSRDDSGHQLLVVPPGISNDPPFFFPFGAGYDTTSYLTNWQMQVQIAVPKNEGWDIWDPDDRVSTLISALQFMHDRFGPPPGVSKVTVFPWSAGRSRTGILCPGYIPHQSLGGFCSAISRGVVAQWLSSSAELHSYREAWIVEAIVTYLGYMLVEDMRGIDQFYTNLSGCRESVRSIIEQNVDVPLASSSAQYGEKGAWVIHMIRNLMNSVDSTQDATFSAWMVEVVNEINNGSLSNQAFQGLTEQFFGYKLDWFFKRWIQEVGIPKYRVEYSTSRREDGYYLDLHVVTEGVSDDYMAPVFLRIDLPPDISYANCFISAGRQSYHLGPYEREPKELHFNKSYSVLSDDRVVRKR